MTLDVCGVAFYAAAVDLLAFADNVDTDANFSVVACLSKIDVLSPRLHFACHPFMSLLIYYNRFFTIGLLV